MLILVLLVLLLLAHPAFGQEQEALLPPDELKKMSIEELMDIEVRLVSRWPGGTASSGAPATG